METAIRIDIDKACRESARNLFKLALGFLGNEADAEDAVQETFCKALAASDSFRGESAVSTWLYRICVNVSKDRMRRRKRLPVEVFTADMGLTMDEILEASPGSDPLTLALTEDIRLKCLFCFSECLPRRQRQVFCLSHVMELDHKTIADVLCISPNAVKASLFRARERMDGYLFERCRFIRPENPCSCDQWVRFGIKRGIVRIPEGRDELERRAERVRREVGSLLDLRRLYAEAFAVSGEELFLKRVREGITGGEWFSL